MNAHRLERGQALVIIILSIVAIMGFAALAVDVGRIYAERRRAQNAADTAALAAAYAAADTLLEDEGEINTLLVRTAFASAIKNGFNNDQVEVHNPPSKGNYEECRCEYIEVIIHTRLQPIFAQFVFRGTEAITTSAVARGRRNPNLSEGNAIHALSTVDDSFEVDGNTKVKVTGGNIFSNGGGLKNGNGSDGSIEVKNGKIKIAQDDGWVCNGCGAGTVKPAPITRDTEGDIVPETILDVPKPYCPATNETWKGVNYYVHGDITGSMTLQRGIHCVSGDIKLNGGDKLTGDGVLIVMLNGGITINGNATVDLKRLSKVIDKKQHSYNGMLIFLPNENSSTIMLGGTADSWISGTIFAPHSTCEIAGNSTATTARAYHTSIICDKVKFNGTPKINIIYNPKENFQMQPLVELIN